MIRTEINNIKTANHNNNTKAAWNTINKITGRKNGASGMLKGKTPDERKAKWYHHFKNLLGQPPSITNENEEIVKIVDQDLPIPTGDFTQEELEIVLKQLPSGKSTGLDGIPAEVWKLNQLHPILLDFCNGLLSSLEKPDDWSVSGIVPIPKKGDLSDSNNYRGISLMPIATKIFNRLLLNRIRPTIDPILRTNQNGFRQSRSTVSHIIGLRRIIEGVKAKNLPCTITFVDFKKAFDSIHRGKMMKILRAYGIPPKIVDAINRIYTGTKAVVLSPEGETDPFDIEAGVLQGDTLAPYLFIIVLDYEMRKAIGEDNDKLGFTVNNRLCSRKPAEVITDLDFADDIALLSDTNKEAQELLTRVEKAASSTGLQMNVTKTKIMQYNQPKIAIRSLDNTEIDTVEDFQYLGSWVDSSEQDITTRKKKAWVACNKLSKIWKSNLPNKIKLQLFRSTVESVLLYGAESWTLTKKLQQSLDGCYTRMLMTVQNMDWRQHYTISDIYGKLPRVSDTIKQKRLQLAGHLHRRKEQLISKLLLWEPKQGKRSRGRPYTTYVNQLCQDTGLNTNQLVRAMDDRSQWKEIVNRVVPTTCRR